MTVFLDVLIFVNVIVTFFILLLCAKINKISYKKIRILMGSLFGGLTALLIVIPQQNLFIELGVKFIVAAFCILISFGYNKAKIYFRNIFCFYIITFVYAGAMYCVWSLTKTNAVYINNSVVYYDVSVMYLIVFSILFYLAFTIIGYFTKREAITASRTNLIIFFKDKREEVVGIFDTGNSVSDLFSENIVIIASKKLFVKLFGENFNLRSEEYTNRYRMLPCKTVAGKQILEGIRCDKVFLYFDNQSYSFSNPLLVIGNTNFTDDFDAILNPEILLNN